MKRKSIGIVVASICLLLSCTNDAIEVTSVKAPEPIYYNTLTITADPTDLFSSYTYEDTYHGVKPLKKSFPTFYSEEQRHIQWRTLIYDKDELLVDSIVEYLSNTNSMTKEKTLRSGDYYAITTLTFTEDSLDKSSMWELLDKEKMSTAKLQPKGRFGQWYVMSQSSEKFAITKENGARIATKPKPVGCIVYSLWENFSKWDPKVYGDSLTEVTLYTKDVTQSFNLDPNATNRYNMRDEPGTNTWYYQDWMYGRIFELYKMFGLDDDAWSYSYIFNTDKTTRLCFGYSMKDHDGFYGSYGQSEYKTEPGKAYLSYWDYDYIGNPYFGVADNNHWDRSK